MKLTKCQSNKMISHSEQEYPNECCGILAGNTDGVRRRYLLYLRGKGSGRNGWVGLQTYVRGRAGIRREIDRVVSPGKKEPAVFQLCLTNLMWRCRRDLIRPARFG